MEVWRGFVDAVEVGDSGRRAIRVEGGVFGYGRCAYVRGTVRGDDRQADSFGFGG